MIVLTGNTAFLNVWWIYLLIGIIFIYVLAQSVFFLVRAYGRARTLEVSKEDLRKTIVSSVIFSIAPSIPILIGLVLLAPIFGSLIAGMRLATLGAYTYEIPAATNVIGGVFNFTFGELLTQDLETFKPIAITAIWVMTLGCIPPLLIVPLFLKKMNNKLKAVKQKDVKWNQIMMDALFIGMISAFVGFVLAPRSVDGSEPFISVLSILVLLSSAVLIILFGLLMKKLNWQWLKNYALPLSMVLSMVLAIIYASLGVM
jgi:hypothetical protein